MVYSALHWLPGLRLAAPLEGGGAGCIRVWNLFDSGLGTYAPSGRFRVPPTRLCPYYGTGFSNRSSVFLLNILAF
jgi:hypothetical protein